MENKLMIKAWPLSWLYHFAAGTMLREGWQTNVKRKMPLLTEVEIKADFDMCGSTYLLCVFFFIFLCSAELSALLYEFFFLYMNLWAWLLLYCLLFFAFFFFYHGQKPAGCFHTALCELAALDLLGSKAVGTCCNATVLSSMPLNLPYCPPKQ